MRAIDDEGLISKIQIKTGCNFATASEIVDSQPTIEMPKWIPVSERLPEDNTYVAVINEYDEYEIAYFSSSRSAHPFSTDYADYKKDWVKVWMPIPEYEEGE